MVLLLDSDACPGGTGRPDERTVLRGHIETYVAGASSPIDRIEGGGSIPDHRGHGAIEPRGA
jgi:hypothetical protein